MEMDEFIKQGIRPRMNNCMVRMISGEYPDYGRCHEGVIDLALANQCHKLNGAVDIHNGNVHADY